MTGQITADEEGTSNDMIRIWKEYCVWYKWEFNQRNRCRWNMKPRTLGPSVSRPQQRNFPPWIGRLLLTTWLVKTNMLRTYMLLYRPQVSNVTLAPKIAELYYSLPYERSADTSLSNGATHALSGNALNVAKDI